MRSNASRLHTVALGDVADKPLEIAHPASGVLDHPDVYGHDDFTTVLLA
jgi:hypothetical protein